MEQKWAIRPFKEGDEAGIFELWKAVYSTRQFDKDKWLRVWQWMNKENPSGKAIIWIAENQNKIVGQYVIVPQLVKLGDHTLSGAQSLDTMTHPDYRHQGIFENLAKAVYREAATKGISIIFGFPNQFSHSGFITKLGWSNIRRMQVMLKVFNWRNTLKLNIKNKFLLTSLTLISSLLFNDLFLRTQKPPDAAGLTITKIATFDKRFDELWLRIRHQSKIMIVRNSDYLNWRYGKPDTNYSIFIAEKSLKVCGYIVILQKIQSGVKMSTICDLIADSEDIMHCLISRAIEEARKDSDLLYHSSITNSVYYKSFRRNGFIPLSLFNSGYFCIYSQSTSSIEALLNPNNWMVQISDSDTV
jgi:hypothetical protein